MRAVVIAALGVAGCYSPTPPTGAPCGENNACPSGQTCIAGFCGGDGTGDTGVPMDTQDIDAPATCTTWNARHFQACAIPAPGGDLVLDASLADYTWDTNTGVLKGKMNMTVAVTTMVLQQTGGPEVLLASVNNFTVSDDANISVTGNRPLVIAVWENAVIDGDINASASLAGTGPGGANTVTTECPASAVGNPGTTTTPSHGGGGGAFQGAGGIGGSASSGNGVGLPVPTVIRGGCGGGSGGQSSGGVVGTRGAGGGAVQITARVSITIPAGGSIAAGGGAGSFGRIAYGGAGGGGSGGYIGLETPTLTVAGVLAANGGAGGGGASDVAQGSPGANGLTSANPAIGGPGATVSNVGACGKGGNGSAGGTLTGDPGVTTSCGGGGGGGGAGYILFWSPTTNVTGTVSPPALSGP
jgi:hypothetical protein